MSGRATVAQVGRWAEELERVGQRIGQHFVRPESRRRAAAYVRGLLGDSPRKNGWQLAEALGEPNPDGVQYLLARAHWDADAVRDELLGYVAGHLGHPQGVLVVDETGFLKKGTKSTGVARQYSGTAGRVENCQIGVFLGYVSPHGRALLDRELYLPKGWAEDAPRRQAARVPPGVRFATKLVLAQRMIQRALDAGVPARWLTADAVYGSDYAFRAGLERRGLSYVVGVRSDQAVWVGMQQKRVRAVMEELPGGSWRRLSCGSGSKGPRLYDWARQPLNGPEPQRYARWLLLRRSVADPTEVAYFVCGGPPQTTLRQLVGVAGQRWAIEECLEIGKSDCGLDEYEVRTWHGWYRHVTLSLFALATAAVIRLQANQSLAPQKGGRG